MLYALESKSPGLQLELFNLMFLMDLRLHLLVQFSAPLKLQLTKFTTTCDESDRLEGTNNVGQSFISFAINEIKDDFTSREQHKPGEDFMLVVNLFN